MKILLIQLLVLFCCVSSLYASAKLKTNLKAQTSQVSFIDQNKLYYIRGLESNKYLENDYSQTYTKIFPWKGSQTQQWKFDFSSGSYYQMRSGYDTDIVITCENMSVCNGTTVASNSYKQKWVVEEYTGPEKNKYGSKAKMVALKNLDFGTYLGAYMVTDGTAVNLWTANTGIQNSKFSVGQIWILEEVSGPFPSIPSVPFSVSYLGGDTGVYLRNLNSGKYLTWISGQTNIGQYDLTRAQNQKWLFRYNDAGYHISSLQNPTYMNFQCESMGSCIVTTSSYSNGYPKQRWQVIDYTGPETDAAGGKLVVLREIEFYQYLGIYGTTNGYTANLWTPNDGLNGAKFSRSQVWVVEQKV